MIKQPGNSFFQTSTDTTLSPEERQQVDEILIDFHDIVARHIFDIGTNSEFKVILTPNDDRQLIAKVCQLRST